MIFYKILYLTWGIYESVLNSVSTVVSITQQKDFVTQNHIHANQRLSITTKGNLTNQHHLYADKVVRLTANHITNQQAGRISSADTQITAKDDLTNEGLVNSVNEEGDANTVVKANGRLINTGNLWQTIRGAPKRNRGLDTIGCTQHLGSLAGNIQITAGNQWWGLSPPIRVKAIIFI